LCSKFDNDYSLVIVKLSIIIIVFIYSFADLCDEINFIYIGDAWNCRCCDISKARFSGKMAKIACLVESVIEVIIG